MSGNWWESAELVQQAPAAPQVAANWWESAPLVQAAPPSGPSRMGAFGRAVTRGAAMGYPDEIAGAASGIASAVTGGQFRPAYEATRDSMREAYRADETAFPMTSLAGQVVGGAALPLGVVGNFARGAASLGGAALRSAGVGAGLGTVAGFGEGEGGAGQRAGSALIGGAAGGVVGAAVPPLFAAGGSLAARMTGGASPTVAAERFINRDLQRGGMTPQELQAASAAAGNAPVSITDLGGENLTGTAEVVARLPGAGRQMAADLLRQRGGANQTARLADTIRTAISGDDFTASMDSLIARRSQTATPAYDAAFQNSAPVDTAPILAAIETRLQTAKGNIASGLERARSLMMQRGTDQPDTTLQGLHETKLALDALLSGTGENAVDRVARREIQGVQRQLVAAMDDASTVNGQSLYQAARAAFAGPSAMMDAMETGRRLLREGPQAAELSAREIAAFSPSERDSFRVGVARALMDRVEASADGAEQTRLRQMFGSPAIRTRLRASFDTDREFNDFTRQLEQEIAIARTNRAIDPRAGSQTMPLQERRADLATPPPSPLSQALTNSERGLAFAMPQPPPASGPVALARNMIGSMNRNAQAGALERNSNALAPMLFSTDPAVRDAITRSLVERQIQDAYRAQALSPLVRAMLSAGGVTGGLAPN